MFTDRNINRKSIFKQILEYLHQKSDSYTHLVMEQKYNLGLCVTEPQDLCYALAFKQLLRGSHSVCQTAKVSHFSLTVDYPTSMPLSLCLWSAVLLFHTMSSAQQVQLR